MPSFQDSAVIFFLALLLFGPKKLPELARYVGKLMGEFRRASSEFRLQMEDEFRISEQAEQQKKLAAIEAAAPTPPVFEQNTSESQAPQPPAAIIFEENAESAPGVFEKNAESASEPLSDHHIDSRPNREVVPIATSGELRLMPPATGLPVARAALEPPTPAADLTANEPQAETVTVAHG